MTSVPASTKYRTSTTSYSARDTYYSSAYNTRASYYSNISTAYDYPLSQPKTKASDKTATAAKPKTSANSMIKINPARIFVLIAVLVAVCFTTLYRQSIILENNQQLKKLNKEYTAILSANQTMQSKINNSFEAGEIEMYAREKLGMMKPDSAQVFYISMQMDDSSGTDNSDSTLTTVTGIQGTLVNAFRVLK